MAGSPRGGAAFGAALAAGDFDDDGYDDLAVGAPGQAYGTDVHRAGAVTVVYGSRDGLTGHRSRSFRQGRGPLSGRVEQWDELGAALATGDVDGDGYDDVAVGVPGETFSDRWEAGEVDVLFGGPDGLGGRAAIVAPGRNGVPGVPVTGGRFGYEVAVGDLDGDGYGDLAASDRVDLSGAVTIVPGAAGGFDRRAGRVIDAGDVPCRCPQFLLLFGAALDTGDLDGDGDDDLAIGAPGWDDGDLHDAGNVSVVFGTADRSDPAATFDQSSFGTTPEAGDWFGGAVVIGSVGAGPTADLVVGGANEDIGGVEDAGIVAVVRGAVGGFPGPATVLHQGEVGGRSEAGDFFGASVATGDYSGDGAGDLLVGAPIEDVAAVRDAGDVTVVDESGGARAIDQGDVGGLVESDEWFGAALA